MRQMLGAMILATVLASGTAAAYGSGSTDLGLPPLEPMGGAAVVSPADEPDVQPAPQPAVAQPDRDQDREGPNQ